jgi:hypothetical protein
MNIAKRYSGTLEEEEGMEDEHKSRDLEIATDPHPIEMWTGPIPAEPKSDPKPLMTGEGLEEDGSVSGAKRISTVRIVALTIIMILTYFLGVSCIPTDETGTMTGGTRIDPLVGSLLTGCDAQRPGHG